MVPSHEGNVRLAPFIRHHRQAADLTQEELAEKTELSVRAIRNLEQGTVRRPRRDTVYRLGLALGLDRDQQAQLMAIARPIPVSSQLRTVEPYGATWAPVTIDLREFLLHMIDQTAAGTVLLIFSRQGQP